MAAIPDSLPHARRASRVRLHAWFGAGAWLMLAAVSATTLLALFVLVTETGDGGALAAVMLRPINLTRLAVMTVCLALWGYILRAGRDPDPR